MVRRYQRWPGGGLHASEGLRRVEASAPVRGTWTARRTAACASFFEQYDTEHEAWQVWFEGYYTLKTGVE